MASLYDSASLVMIPSGYKDDKLYSIKPTDGSGDFTFSRDGSGASPATRVNASGLIEKGRENELTHSNDFTNAVWIKSSVSVTGGQTDPNGGTTAALIENTATASAYIYQVVAGGSTCSVYAKAGTRSSFILINGGYGNGASFDLSAETFTLFGAGVIGKIEDVGNDWYRCSVYVTSKVNWLIGLSNISGGGASIGDNMTFAFPQSEPNSIVATDYIETTTTAVSAGLLGDMPRLDYSGGASCPSLLLEPSRDNLAASSEYISSSDYVLDYVTSSNNEAISPEGVQNAALISGDGSSADHAFYDLQSLSATDYTLSVFVKKNTQRYVFLAFNQLSVATYWSSSVFDLDTLTKADHSSGTYSNGTSRIEDYGNDWYRISLTASIPSATDVIPFVGLADSLGTPTASRGRYAFTTSDSFYAYGYSVESGSYPTSYIPTYGSAAGRAVDSCANTSATDIINQDEGTLFVDFVFNGKQDDIDYYLMAIIDSYSQNEIRLGGYNLALYGRVYSGGTLTFAENYTTGPTIGQRFKVIIKYGSEGVKTFANGQLKDSGTPTLPIGTMDEIRLTRSGVGTHSSIKQSLYFPTALTDAECIALTTI